MKYSKAHLRRLREIHAELKRAMDIFTQPQYYVATTKYIDQARPHGSNYVIVNEALAVPNDHTVLQPRVIGLVTKDIGSDLVGFYRAFGKLDALLSEIRNEELKHG